MILPVGASNSWGPSLDAAVHAVSRGEIIVLPTDTVYGIGCDAFDPAAVEAVLAAKGRDRTMPPPVLVPGATTIAGLAREVPEAVLALIDAFWPGPLTVILHAQPSLAWDLGDTRGTVALRSPGHPAALALLERTGPLAVTSANKTGEPPATTVAKALAQFGEAVSVYLDGGPSPLGEASTIVDATGPTLRMVRLGAIGLEELVKVAGSGAFAAEAIS